MGRSEMTNERWLALLRAIRNDANRALTAMEPGK